jgi:geranylgeranyl transferase type-2 subunit alpha
VTSKAEVPLSEEFTFTHDKIAANFSNYSAWHYRSKLLPLLNPSPDKRGGVAEEALLQEHELAQNAFFTDPSDQSAWLYHRWLLGKAEQSPAVACVLVRAHPRADAFVTFNQPIKGTETVELVVKESTFSSAVLSDWPKSTWQFSLTDDVIPGDKGDLPVAVRFGGVVEELRLSVCDSNGGTEVCWVGGRGPVFGSTPTAATSSVLAAELDSCKELLQMEPENKWCILTTLLLLKALHWQRESGQIAEMFGRLCKVDPYRRGYYQDMLSRFQIECSLAAVFQNGLSSSSPTHLNLSGKGLSRLYHSHCLLHLRSLDLSGNQLVSLSHTEGLVSLETLVADDNKLQELPSTIEKLELLRVLSIRNNQLSDPKQLHCVRFVKVLRLEGNPLCNESSWREAVTSELVLLQELNDVVVALDAMQKI